MTSKELYTKGCRVWVEDKQVIWRAAQLTRDWDEKSLEVEFEDDGSRLELPVARVTDLPFLRNPDILVSGNDLTALSYLHEPAVLHNLQVRFCSKNIIYTYCGIVLVAINPYESLDIYNETAIWAYRGASMGDLDPHIYAISEEAYTKMEREGRNQSIIVSGESGAGKTMSAKYAMRFFATVGGESTESRIEAKVIASNPIMEAIGNAKTTRNDNSSRFGKYIQIDFNAKHIIVGAHMRTYLLEKSRVVYQANDERNYHVFYQLCAAGTCLDEWKHLRLRPSDEFRYINQGESPTIRDVDDLAQFKAFVESLTTLQFSKDDQASMFKVLASILHLGNITFVKGDGGSRIEVDQPEFVVFCDLLQLDKDKVKQALCVIRVPIGREIVTKHQKPAEASMSRNALAKHMYAALFDWIVDAVNRALAGKEKRKHFIGVLDIYGFETFERNSFEQFCINYANEKLQQQFNQHVFKLEQEEYAREEIQWSYIDFYDNQPCINLIETKLGILDLLDEECRLPKGSDEQWCQKLYTQCKAFGQFKKPKLSQEQFIVVHFAGEVSYDCHGFKDKNMDTVVEDQLDLLASARLPFAAALFRKPDAPKSSQHQPTSGAKKQHKMTVGSQFRQSLQLLMETLNATTPHYVRCIKPNDDKSAFTFDPHRATQQLRACGVLETVRISAAGFPSRWTYGEFMQRYRMLATAKTLSNNADHRQNCTRVLELLLKDPDKFQFGKTKIFFRAGQVAYLEKLRNDKLNQAAIMIQKVVKGFVYRRRYLSIIRAVHGVQRRGRGLLARRKARALRETAAAVRIQTAVRGFLARRRYAHQRKLAVRLQCIVRGYLARRRYEAMRRHRAAVIIQARVRGFLERCRFAANVHKVVLCQAAVRRFLARRLRKRMKEEEKKVEHWKTQYKGLENKIISQKQEMIDLAKARDDARHKLTMVEHQWKDKVRTLEDLLRVANDRNKEYEERMNALNTALEMARKGEMDANDKIEAMSCEMEQLKTLVASKEASPPPPTTALKESMVAQLVTDPSYAPGIDGVITVPKWTSEKRLLVKELEELKTDYQRLLEERDGMMSKIYGDPHSSPSNSLRVHQRSHHQRTPSDVSAGSDLGREAEEATTPMSGASSLVQVGGPHDTASLEKDNGYGTVSRNGSIREDVATILKFETRVKDLEAQNSELLKQLEYQQQIGEPSTKDLMRLHELVRENAKLKESLKNISMAESPKDGGVSAVSSTTVVDGQTEGAPAGRNGKMRALLEELWAELDTKREEIRGLREALTREGQGMTHLPNRDEEGEIYMAFETQKTMLNQLENELNSMKMSARECEHNFNAEIRQLREHNQQLQQIISSEMTPAEKATSFLQGEVARLSRENVDLKEKYDRAIEQIRRLKRQSKVTSTQHNAHSDVSDSMPMIRHKTETTGSFLGMLEYKIEDETHIIRSLIIDLKPKVTQQLLPALPAYILVMMIRHVDHCNDDQKVRSLLNNVITNVRRVIKKRKDDLEYTAMWLTIMYRFFNNLRQYSGEEVYQNENTPRQNEQCLRNFDLSQYRQIISDICLFIYTQMVRSMTDRLQKIVIPAIIEHDATGGSHLFRRKGSLHHDTSSGQTTEVDASKALDQLLDELTAFNKLIQSHQVDVDVRVVMFKELYHFVCAMSLNNLLLRRDMCHWSKGVQIRHNLSRLEHWSREQHLFGVNDHLAPAIQAVQVLQARKREDDIPDICEMAPNLTSGQLLRICQMYTPVEGYEESFSPKFISRLQEYIKNTFPKDNSKDYLMDTKARLAVRFQYIPSDVQLETITVPEVLNLPMLKRI